MTQVLVAQSALAGVARHLPSARDADGRSALGEFLAVDLLAAIDRLATESTSAER